MTPDHCNRQVAQNSTEGQPFHAVKIFLLVFSCSVIATGWYLLPRTYIASTLGPHHPVAVLNISQRQLPQTACTDAPRFAYLVTVAGDSFPPSHIGDFSDLMNEPDVKIFVASWKRPLPPYVFRPNSSFGENRNALLEQAVEYEIVRGCRFTYYVWVDEHCPSLKFDLTTAPLDGIRTDQPPHAAFRALLLEWMPAVGVPRYAFMPRFNASIPVQAHTVINWDHVLVAMHFTAARLLLPYDTEAERTNWIPAQILMDLQAAALYLEHVLMFRSLLSFPKAPHVSSTAVYGSSGALDWNLMESTLRTSVRQSALLSSRVFPILNAHPVDGLELRSPRDVRYDVDLRPLGITADHPVWRRPNAFWARFDSCESNSSSKPSDGFGNLLGSTGAYEEQVTNCSARPCLGGPGP